MDPTKISQFNFPTVVRFGSEASKELGPYLKQQGLAKPLLVTDSTVAGLDFFLAILQSLKGQGISVEVFADIHRNPVKSDVYKGTEAFDNLGRDCIVGLGGGAALDVSRAIALRVNHRDDLFTYDDALDGAARITNDVPHFITIPTTAGTGSEVGRSAIISGDDDHRKRILFSPKLLARIVFADPGLTQDLPPAITAATGMDALTHNMEAYLAKMWHPLCEGIALEGMRLIAESLGDAVNRPDILARSKMLVASLMGAVAFQKGLGVVHSLAHPMSSLLDTHHGLANAVNIPFGMRFNLPHCPDKFARMSWALGLANHTGDAVIEFLFRLNEAIGIPKRLRELGVKPEHVEPLADLAELDFAHATNPVPVRRSDFKILYEEAL